MIASRTESKRGFRLATVIVLCALGAFSVGCHADNDDPVGQAEELKDPVRRAHAVSNLQRIYTQALDRNDGNRQSAPVVQVADAIAEPLSQAYIDYPENTRLGKLMLDIMKEMRDPRTLPALMQALRWRQGVTEEHAVRAAQTIQVMDVPENKVGEVIDALADGLGRVNGSRPLDNQIRREMLIALGKFEDSRAAPALTEVAVRRSEDQNILFNRLAVQQLGRIAGAESVPALIKCLFLFDPNNLGMRMNDVAAEALVRVGRPSYEPLLETLRGENAQANALVEAYIAAVRQRDEAAADRMSVETEVGKEATFAIGALGLRDALDPLIAETQADNPFRKFNASIAIVRLNLEPGDLARVRETLTRVFNEMPDGLDGARLQLQLIAIMRQLYDPELLGHFKALAENTDIIPDLSIEASLAYALLANRAEANEVRRCPDTGECEGQPYEDTYQANAAILDAARECNEEISCWIGKLNESDPTLVRKAAFMLGRYGRGNERAMSALTDKLSHEEAEIRLTALAALDHIATDGYGRAVEEIDRLQQEEDGRRVWNLFRSQALPTQARLRVRARSGG